MDKVSPPMTLRPAALHRELAEELGATATGAARAFLPSSPSGAGVVVPRDFVARLAGLDESARSPVTRPGVATARAGSTSGLIA